MPLAFRHFLQTIVWRRNILFRPHVKMHSGHYTRDCLNQGFAPQRPSPCAVIRPGVRLALGLLGRAAETRGIAIAGGMRIDFSVGGSHRHRVKAVREQGPVKIPLFLKP